MDINAQNNHLKGTVFNCDPTSLDSPIQRGVITIDGTRLRVAVFPKKIAQSGREYYPIRLQYTEDTRSILRSVSTSTAVEARVI